MPITGVKKRLDQLATKGVRRIHFLGGEPLCRRDLPEVVSYATGLGILCSINTNGTLIPRDVAEALVAAGTFLLTFSIDGADAETNDAIRGKGAFDRLVQRPVAHVLPWVGSVFLARLRVFVGRE